MITLYQFEISPFCDKIRRVLNVKGAVYSVHEVPPSRVSRMKAISPTGKFPVLEHDGRLISDSTEIALYLDRAFPEPALYPSGRSDRALAMMIEDWADESLYFFEMFMRIGWPGNARRWVPELMKDDTALFRALAPRLVPGIVRRQASAQGIGRKRPEQILKELDRHFDAIEGLLGSSDWLVGGQLSIADIAVYAQLFCIAGTEEAAPMIRARPGLSAFMQRVDEATRRR